MQSTTKRHPSAIHMRVGATRDGQAFVAWLFTASSTPAPMPPGGRRWPTGCRSMPRAPICVPDYRARVDRRSTPTARPSGAFRGFGVPQSAIAQESLFDELADKLGMDALEFRLLNALENGSPTVCGQVFAQASASGLSFRRCARPGQSARAEVAAPMPAARSEARRRAWRRAGMAAAIPRCPTPRPSRRGIRADGTVVLHQGATDIGQGSNTVIAQIFAEALGVPVRSLAADRPRYRR